MLNEQLELAIYKLKQENGESSAHVHVLLTSIKRVWKSLVLYSFKMARLCHIYATLLWTSFHNVTRISNLLVVCRVPYIENDTFRIAKHCVALIWRECHEGMVVIRLTTRPADSPPFLRDVCFI